MLCERLVGIPYTVLTWSQLWGLSTTRLLLSSSWMSPSPWNDFTLRNILLCFVFCLHSVHLTHQSTDFSQQSARFYWNDEKPYPRTADWHPLHCVNVVTALRDAHHPFLHTALLTPKLLPQWWISLCVLFLFHHWWNAVSYLYSFGKNPLLWVASFFSICLFTPKMVLWPYCILTVPWYRRFNNGAKKKIVNRSHRPGKEIKDCAIRIGHMAGMLRKSKRRQLHDSASQGPLFFPIWGWRTQSRLWRCTKRCVAVSQAWHQPQ